MPLMLINHSPFWTRVYATLSVVQLCFLALSSVPKRLYRADTSAKYQDDDGGPSKYWLDWSVRLLKQRMDVQTVGAEEEQQLARLASDLDDSTRQRFAAALRDYGKVSDVADFVEYFARRERRRSSRIALLPWLLSLPTAVLLRYGSTWWTQGWVGVMSMALVIALIVAIAWWLYRKIPGPPLARPTFGKWHANRWPLRTRPSG